jgi:hypothetical protein
MVCDGIKGDDEGVRERGGEREREEGERKEEKKRL